jgi:hypothetical protein
MAIKALLIANNSINLPWKFKYLKKLFAGEAIETVLSIF